MSLTKVVLIGATGSIGSIILTSLLASPALEVTAVTRQGSASKLPSNPNLKTVQTAYDLPSLTQAFQGQDVVISAVGAEGLGSQKVFVDAAIEAGVKRFLPSEFSVNTLSKPARELVPLFEFKFQLLEYLKSKEATGLTWTGLASGLLFDWGLKAGSLAIDVQNKSATLWDQGEHVFSLTNEKTLGEAIISILAHPKETANKYLYISSISTTQKAILEFFEEQSGEQWSKTYVTTKQQIEFGKANFPSGNMAALFALLQATAFGKVSGNPTNYETEEGFANDLLEIKRDSVDETVKKILESAV